MSSRRRTIAVITIVAIITAATIIAVIIAAIITVVITVVMAIIIAVAGGITVIATAAGGTKSSELKSIGAQIPTRFQISDLL